MKSTSLRGSRRAGFTLVEVMTSMTIVGIVMAGALSVYVVGLKAMYKDNQRLSTNATLRYFIAQISKETLDSTEFYVFSNYTALDGSVDLAANVATPQADGFGTSLAHGDCLVLVTRISADVTTSNIRQFKIYYRVTTDPNTAAAIRYYESSDYGVSGTATSLTALLNAVNLNGNSSLVGTRQIVAKARGRLQAGSATACYPIFSSEAATSVNACVAINVEVINGTTANNMLSSSSFNYTISPRK